MRQKEDIYETARKLGIVDGYVNGSELETMQKIAKEMGMDHYNGLSNADTDELQRRIKEYEKNNSEKDDSSETSPSGSQRFVNRGLNAATGGNWDKVRNAPIIGAAAKKAEDKMADKFGNTKLGKALDKHQRPNLGAATNENQQKENGVPASPNGADVGSQNLRNSIANKAKNFLGIGKKKKNKPDDSSSEEEKKDESSDEEKKEEEKKEDSKEKAYIKRKIQIRLALIGLGAFLLYFLVMTIASALTGGGVFKVAPFSSLDEVGTESFKSVTPEDSKAHAKEMKFYDKIKESVKEYGDEVNMNYVVAILMDVFYEYDPSYTYEDLSEEEQQELMEAGGLDYDKMTKNVDKFAKLIQKLKSTENEENTENDGNTTNEEGTEDNEDPDYKVGGKIYNALMNSSEFTSYYKEAIDSKIKNKEGTKKEILEEILNNVFRLAKEIHVDEDTDDTTLTDETEVDNTVNDKVEKMSINEYMADSIYASTNKLSSPEVVKAYTIAYSTNLVAANKKLTINENTASTSNELCSVKEGCSYDSNGKLVKGAGSQSNDNPYYYNGNYYYKVPLSNDEQKNLNNSINSTFGNVLVNKDGTYPTLDLSVLDGFGDGDGDYKEIIKKAYGDDYKYKNVGENSYILDGSYGTKKVKTEVIFYDQKDYTNTFCGLTGYTIGGSGCGVTAMAIVVSTYENNKKYTPIYMNSEAKKMGMCGSTGTSQGFFGKEAKAMNYKYASGTKYNKTILNSTLKHLAQGDLVVVRMGAGHFTGGGHYMVLGGVDPETKKVYVYDPNNKSNSGYRKTGNGWYSFNDIIVKEAYNFYVIWKG